MVVFLIGLGLSDEKDITVRGLEAVRSCARVYLEAYTAILGVDKDKLEAFYGCKVILSDREMVETGYAEIVEGADKENTALLVVGDPMAGECVSMCML
jgi:diphthine synthase